MQYLNSTASVQAVTGQGEAYGIIVNSHSSGTLRLNNGLSSTTSAGVKATGVFTSSGAIANNETLVIAGITYTFKTTLTGAANEVLLDVSVAAALDNLKVAINKGAGIGVKYGTGTVANPNVTATTNTNTAQTIEAIRVGTYANAFATTETCTNCAWGAATMESGAEPSFLILNTITFASGPAVYTFPAPISFDRGLYITKGGTIDYTLIYQQN